MPHLSTEHDWAGVPGRPDVDASKCMACGLVASAFAVETGRIPYCDDRRNLDGAFISLGYPWE